MIAANPEKALARVKASHLGNAKGLAARPLAFIENRGQFNDRVKFQVPGNGQTLWLTGSGIVFDFARAKSIQTDPKLSEALPGKVDASTLRDGGNPRIEKPAIGDAERQVIYEDFVGTNRDFAIETKGVQQGAYNYITGNDPSKWQTEVPAFSEVVYHDVWDGVDLRLYGNGPDLEQEFIVKPRANLNLVHVSYQGIDRLEIANDGGLLIHTAAGQMRETAPRIYQEIAGGRVSVEGQFKLLTATSYTFEVSAFKKEYALVVDPTLLYSTFLGGSSSGEAATGIAVDSAGNAYVTGYTASTDFPITPGSFQTSSSGGQQTFVAKLNHIGSSLVYSTYLNAPFPAAISVDRFGNAYVAGWNAQAGFPTTSNAYNQSCLGSGFLTVLNQTGTGLVYSTCFGERGSASLGYNGAIVSSMVADAAGHTFITGYTNNPGFPTTPNAYQSSYPGARGTSAFVSVFDTKASGSSSLVYSTYFGIPSANFYAYGTTGNGIAIDPFGNAYITGYAGDSLPVTAGAFQTSLATGVMCNPYGGQQWVCPDAFIAKLNPNVAGSQSLIYSTYLGGPGNDNGSAIAVDPSGNAFVTGFTQSASFPVTASAFQTTPSCGSNLFVTKLNAGGSKLVYSTYLSGNCYANNNSANGIAVDSLGNAYVAGSFRAQASSTFPLTADAFQSSFLKVSGDFSEAFLTKFNPAGTALVYSTYIGGSGDDVATAVAVDQTGAPYVVGHTSSSDFPVTTGSFQTVMNGTGDAFVLKFSTPGLSQVFQIFPTSGGNTGSVTLTVAGTFAAGSSIALSCAGGQNISGTNLAIQPNLHTLSATFNLVGVNPGTCNIVITGPGGSSVTLPQTFTVKQGGTPQLWVSVIGTPTIRVQFPQTYYIGYGNYGNVDALGVHLLIYVPSSLAPSLNLGNANGVSTTIVQGATATVAINLGRVPANSTGLVPISLTAFDSTQPPFQIRVDISGH